MLGSRALAVAILILLCAPAYAGKADVLFVELAEQPNGHWNIAVKCGHEGDAKDHYCNWWELRTPNGGWVYKQKLDAPPQSEPFTSTVSDVEIHHGATELIAEANCCMHGLGGKKVLVDLGVPSGEGFKVVRCECAPPSEADRERIAQLIEQMGGGTMKDSVRAREIRDQLIKIGRSAVPQLLEAAEKHKDPWVRICAIGTLGSLREPAAIDVMITATHDPFDMLRLVATGNLTRFVRRDPKIVAALLERMSDPFAQVRQQAAQGLLRCGPSPEVVDALKKNLQNDDAEIRIQNMALLAKLVKADDPVSYVKGLFGSPNAPVRSAAYGALGQFPPKKDAIDFYVDFFAKALDDHSDPVQREGVRGFLWLLRGGKEDIAPGTMEAIGKIVDEKVPPLVESGNKFLRGDAVYLISLRKREAAFPLVLKLTRDESSYVRECALRGLVNTRKRGAEAGEAIAEALTDKSPEVNKTALKVMRWFMAEEAENVFTGDAAKGGDEALAEASRKWWAENRGRFPK